MIYNDPSFFIVLDLTCDSFWDIFHDNEGRKDEDFEHHFENTHVAIAGVCSRKLSSSLKVPLTVAFSAPGVHHAARVLLGKLGGELHDKLEQESMTTITVSWPEKTTGVGWYFRCISKAPITFVGAIIYIGFQRWYCTCSMLRSQSCDLAALQSIQICVMSPRLPTSLLDPTTREKSPRIRWSFSSG